MKLRIATLILAHRPEALSLLVKLLPPPFDIFVHYDKKSGDLPAVSAQNLRFVSPRREVFWGGFSMIEATLDLLRTASAHGNYERYLLISGDSLPLREPLALAEALLWPNVEYIQLVPLIDDPSTAGMSWDEIRAKLTWEHPGRFYNFQNWDSLLTNPFTEEALCRKYRLSAQTGGALRGEVVRFSSQLLNALPARPRLFKKFYYGTQWWALTPKLLGKISDELFSKEVQNYFRFMEVPDEHYFNCVVGNLSPESLEERQVFWGSPVVSDHSSRLEGRSGISLDVIRTMAKKRNELFIRKFLPDEAGSVADSICSGRYNDEVLQP